MAQPELLFPGIYRIRIPLPKSPLKELNSYLILGAPRNLLIDTGFHHPVCLQAMQEALAALDVSMENTDIFLTHLHYDHSGNAGSLAAASTRIYCNEIDKAIVESYFVPGFDDGYALYLRRLGIPPVAASARMDVLMHQRYSAPPNTGVAHGALLRCGDYTLECIHTPGHTPGHMCLYEREQQLLFCGDHILFNISPNITCWEDRADSLGDYLQSLKAIRAFPVRTMLCGHRENPQDHAARIDELLEHHRLRLAESAGVLARQGPLTAYEAAAHMVWHAAGGWDTMPLGQRYFATGEAAAHLDHLVAGGRAAREDRSGVVYYSTV